MMFIGGDIKENAIKIVYITGSNPIINNARSLKRLEEAEKRCGVDITTVSCRLGEPFSKEIEKFSAAFFIGNSHNMRTFDAIYNMPPVHYLINSGYMLDIPFDRREKKCNSFLFFASSGQVHKGLDLLLDIFSQKYFPCELYICSAYGNEPQFVAAYKKELFDMPNIHAMGFIAINSKKFADIVKKCAYLIVPSCAEGQMGSALTVMSAGVIPILSQECGFDDDEAILLPDCELETIKNIILEYSQKSMDWVDKKSHEVIDMTRKKHSKEMFIQSLRQAFDKTLVNRKGDI